MIGLLAKILIAGNPAMTLGHAMRLAKVGAIAAAIVAAAVGGWLWLHFHDKGVIQRADDKRHLQEATEAIEGERRADRGEEGRRKAREADSDQTTTNMKEAEDAHPEEARAPAGPVSRAAADRLRR